MMSPEVKMAWVMGLPVECFQDKQWRRVITYKSWCEIYANTYGPFPDPDDQYKYRLAPNDLDPA